MLPFAIAFFLAYRPLRELTDARLAFARARGAVDALQRLGALDFGGSEKGRGQESIEADGGEREPVAWEVGVLEVEELALTRGHCAPISFRAEAGQIVVVLGRTGVGKTTFLRTLLGLERAHRGRVRYGASALEDAPIGPAARPFAWVPQDSPVLLDTLEANVRVSPDADAAGASLDALGAGHLVAQLGSRRLGSEERPVSGGERQWISLARAMATKMPVLLLDEPTSGLDTEAQSRVLEAIARLRGRRTVILVTHRTEPLAIADVVVKLGAPVTRAASADSASALP